MLALWLAAALADGPTPPASASYRFSLRNLCHERVGLAVGFLKQGRWVTRGVWGVEPGATVMTDLLTATPKVYYYAWSEHHTWAGDGTPGGARGPLRRTGLFELPMEVAVPDAESVLYRPVDLTSQNHVQEIHCPAPTGAPPPAVQTFEQQLLAACRTEHNPANHVQSCLTNLARRTDAFVVAQACNQLERKHRMGCYRTVGLNYRVDAEPAIRGCIQAFGFRDQALDCIKGLDRARDPHALIQACAPFEGIAATQCLEAAQQTDRPPVAAIDSCAAGFPDKAYGCIKLARTMKQPQPIVTRCGTLGEEGMECLKLSRKTHPDVVGACFDQLERNGDRLRCLEANQGRTDATELSACATEKDPKQRLRCLLD